jgi:AP-1 complex subunit beta-1
VALQVIIQQLAVVEDDTLKKSLLRKMAPPLVTLLSNESELQYVVLRNVSIIVHSYPEMLDLEVKVFFCKYNDPIYVKMVSCICKTEAKLLTCMD